MNSDVNGDCGERTASMLTHADVRVCACARVRMCACARVCARDFIDVQR